MTIRPLPRPMPAKPGHSPIRPTGINRPKPFIKPPQPGKSPWYKPPTPPKTLPPGPTSVRILGRTLLRMAPFLNYLLSPTAVADGTIKPSDQRALERWHRTAAREPGTKAPSFRVSESAVSGASIIGRWLEVVNTPALKLPVKLRDLGRVLGDADLTDISDLLDRYSPAPKPDPAIDTEALERRGAVKHYRNLYDAHPDRAVRDLKDKRRRPYAENWLRRNWWRDPRRNLGVRPVVPELPLPVSPPRPTEKPAPRPAPGLSKPKPDYDPGPETVPEVISPPQSRPLYWPEVVIDVSPTGIRFRERLVRDRPPRRERDKKAERKGAAYALHRLVTGGWGLYTEASDLVNMFIDNLRWADSGREFRGGRTRRALELFVDGKLELDTVGFMQDFAMNSIEDAVIGRINAKITEALDVQNPAGSPITHVQKLNRLNAEKRYRTLAESPLGG